MTRLRPISSPARPAVPRPARLVVRGVNWLGDAIMSTPALQRLREAQPRAHIALLTPAKLEDLWRHHPAVDQVIPVGPADGLFAVAARLRRGQFDTALILPNSPRSALESFFAGIPVRIGYQRGLRHWFLTHPLPPRPQEVAMHQRSIAEIRRLVRRASATRPALPAEAHHVHQYLHLAAALGADPRPAAPQLVLTPQEVAAARSRFIPPKARAERWIGLNAGAEYGPAKRWPVDGFVQAAAELQARIECAFLIVGGPRDLELAAALAAELTSASVAPVINLAGQTTLRELCAVLQPCRVVITNDTGPMHVAAAVGTPVVVPFGSTAPELTGPLSLGGARHFPLAAGVPCSPCFLRECPIDFRCMHGISTAQVAAAVLDALCLAPPQPPEETAERRFAPPPPNR
jgi:heptosyltransferase II